MTSVGRALCASANWGGESRPDSFYTHNDPLNGTLRVSRRWTLQLARWSHLKKITPPVVFS